MVEELNTICLKESGITALQHLELQRNGLTTTYSSECSLKKLLTVFVGEYRIYCGHTHSKCFLTRVCSHDMMPV